MQTIHTSLGKRRPSKHVLKTLPSMLQVLNHGAQLITVLLNWEKLSTTHHLLLLLLLVMMTGSNTLEESSNKEIAKVDLIMLSFLLATCQVKMNQTHQYMRWWKQSAENRDGKTCSMTLAADIQMNPLSMEDSAVGRMSLQKRQKVVEALLHGKYRILGELDGETMDSFTLLSKEVKESVV